MWPLVNKYTRRAEIYWNITYAMPSYDQGECKLKTCLVTYGGGDNKHQCEILGSHVYCYCDHCVKHPTCLRCRLYINTGHYL